MSNELQSNDNCVVALEFIICLELFGKNCLNKKKGKKDMTRKNVWETYDKKALKKLEKLNAEYREFLDNGKTERECIDTIVNMIEKEGYQELESVIKSGKTLKQGDKVYSVWMNKCIAMFKVGRTPMTEGMNILGAHIDSPRLDVKQNPLYEDPDHSFAYLDTHYYGGVKKYQWGTIPLAIHGVGGKKRRYDH